MSFLSRLEHTGKQEKETKQFECESKAKKQNRNETKLKVREGGALKHWRADED